MDFIIYIISAICIMVLVSVMFDDSVRKSLKIQSFKIMITLVSIMILTYIVSFQMATTTVEKLYSVSCYNSINFDEPADLLVTTTIYPKWSVLSTDITFTQIPKGN